MKMQLYSNLEFQKTARCFVYFAFFKFQKCLQRRNACGPHPQETKTRIENDMVSVKYVLDFNLLFCQKYSRAVMSN
jgi:hypothetical protein